MGWFLRNLFVQTTSAALLAACQKRLLRSRLRQCPVERKSERALCINTRSSSLPLTSLLNSGKVFSSSVFRPELDRTAQRLYRPKLHAPLRSNRSSITLRRSTSLRPTLTLTSLRAACFSSSDHPIPYKNSPPFPLFKVSRLVRRFQTATLGAPD